MSVVGDRTVQFGGDDMAVLYSLAASVQILASGRPVRDT